jgi:hypothetical protein
MSDSKKIAFGIAAASLMFAALLMQRGDLTCGGRMASGPRIGDVVMIAGCP